MRMPAFTAEASLAKATRRYVLTPQAGAGGPAAAGKVVPQGVWLNSINNHLYYFDDLGNFIDLGYTGPIYVK